MSFADPLLEYVMPRSRLASPRSSETPKMRLVSILESLITDSIVSQGRTAIFTLGEESQVFWPDPRRGAESEPVTREELLAFAMRSWRPVGTLESLLRYHVTDQFLIPGEEVRLGDELPSLACLAHYWGRLLTRQLGAGDDMATTNPRTRVTQACFAALNNARQIQIALDAAVRGVIVAIEAPPGARTAAARPVMVRFERHDETITACWLAGDGRELAREPLASLMQRVRGSRRLDPPLRELARLQGRQFAYVAAAKELLDRGCPELAEAVKYACSRRRLTCYTVCPQLSVHGLPAQVCLYLDPSRARLGPTAILVARRAHEEFILQNPAGVLLYFPPVQLEARIVFRAAHETWEIPNPRVRMPRGCPLFVHPYAGRLDPDLLASAHMITPGGPEPMAGMSAAGRRLLPRSVECYDVPASNDICLTGQRRTVGRISETIRRAESADRDPDVAAAVLCLWNIASLGLTHGHTNNRDHPRIDLNKTELYYPIRRPRNLSGTALAERISPYNPSRPVVL